MPRILLVDDDELFRTMLHLTLQKLGHEVVSVADGQQALKVQQASPVDVVVTDLIMPEKEGLETIQRLRQEYPKLRIIAMSGGARLILARDFLSIAKLLGANRTLVKPFATSDLISAIEGR